MLSVVPNPTLPERLRSLYLEAVDTELEQQKSECDAIIYGDAEAEQIYHDAGVMEYGKQLAYREVIRMLRERQ